MLGNLSDDDRVGVVLGVAGRYTAQPRWWFHVTSGRLRTYLTRAIGSNRDILQNKNVPCFYPR